MVRIFNLALIQVLWPRSLQNGKNAENLLVDVLTVCTMAPIFG
jgi:hypothetical protein